ncbi:MAG: F0F1 ATP synthase subunit delta [Mycoplasma sp.]|nr:F0F1 ATP synthase subunit delta [Mycoplasma sp.]
MLKNELKIGYSLAILDIAKEEKKIKEIYNQSNILLNVLDEQNEFVEILDSSIDEKTKSKLIEKTFKNIHWSLINVAQMLAFKNNFKYFKDILKKLIKYLQDILQIEQGIVYSVKRISETNLKKLEAKLTKEFNKKISLKNLIDKELIGGFKIVIGSVVIEDSVKSDLALIKKSLVLKE